MVKHRNLSGGGGLEKRKGFGEGNGIAKGKGNVKGKGFQWMGREDYMKITCGRKKYKTIVEILGG